MVIARFAGGPPNPFGLLAPSASLAALLSGVLFELFCGLRPLSVPWSGILNTTGGDVFVTWNIDFPKTLSISFWRSFWDLGSASPFAIFTNSRPSLFFGDSLFIAFSLAISLAILIVVWAFGCRSLVLSADSDHLLSFVDGADVDGTDTDGAGTGVPTF